MTLAVSPPRKAPAQASAWRDFTAVQPRRALLLMGAGAVAGLLIAGVALFTAKGTTTLTVPADAVAMVNQQPLSRIDFDGQLSTLGLDPIHASRADKRRVLEDMIREELFVQRAKELDVALVDPEVRSAMVRAVEAQAAANALTAAPTEAEVRAYYEAHRAKYASEGVMTVRDLVFPAGAAAQARAALASGVPVAGVLARFGGRDTGRTGPDEFYFAAKIHLGDALFAAARPLPDGGVSQPIAVAGETHVLVMARNALPKPYAYDAARPQVVSDRQAESIARYQKAEGDFLRKRANVLLAKDLR